jgi:hypothetical protein
VLALFKADLGRFNGGQPVLPELNLGRIVQIGLVGVGGFLDQCVNLGLKFKLRALHAPIAHGLAAAGFGFDLAAVYCDGGHSR